MSSHPQPAPQRPSARKPVESFSSNDVSAMTGVSLRQLQWWDEQGVVSPAQSGHRRLYRMAEVVEIALITELRAKRISLQKIRRVLAFLKDELGDRYLDAIRGDGEVHLLTDGEKLYLERDHRSIVDILKNSLQPLIGVCISDQVERLSARVETRKSVGRQKSEPRAGRAARAS